jgi:hypothetical protein
LEYDENERERQSNFSERSSSAYQQTMLSLRATKIASIPLELGLLRGTQRHIHWKIELELVSNSSCLRLVRITLAKEKHLHSGEAREQTEKYLEKKFRTS